MHGLGERARPREPSGAPRARHVEDSTGLQPHFFHLSPRGRVLVPPRAGAIPETMALSRYWRGSMTPVSVVRLGSAAASRVDFVAELVMSFDRVLWGLARAERCLVFLLTQHILIFKYVDTLDQKPA